MLLLKSLGVSESTPQIESVVDFYCGQGFLPEEIAIQITAALNLPEVLEALRAAGVMVTSSVRENILAGLRRGESVKTILDKLVPSKAPKP